jgi:chaperonin cofactor prefoldin
VRDLKNTRTVVDNNSQQIRDLENRIERLENQNRYLQGVVNLLQNHLTKR